MKFKIIYLLLLFIYSNSYSQKNNTIYKAWAYNITNVGGAPMAIEEGEASLQKPTLQIFVLLKKPILQGFNIYLQNGISYTASARKVMEYPLKFADGEVIMAKKADLLYELILTETKKNVTGLKIKTQLQYNSLIISYFAKGYLYTYPIKSIVNKNISLL